MLDARRVLIVGYGSAGRRHLSVLSELGCLCAVVSRTEDVGAPSFREVGEALSAFRPDYVVIANETASHLATLQQLGATDFRGICMVEKPLFKDAESDSKMEFPFPVYVGYNLRFHPKVQQFRSDVLASPVTAVRAHVGQYLPDWRPLVPIEQTYSVSRDRGGGVLRDLSHELDFLTWTLGPWKRLAALGGKLSELPGDVEDCVAILVEAENCRLLEIHLDYLDRRAQRDVLVQFPHITKRYDLLSNPIDDSGSADGRPMDRHFSTKAMHQAVLGGSLDDVCDFRSGLAVNVMINAIERALREKTWVEA